MTATAIPRHLTFTILPDGHINASMGAVWGVTHDFGQQDINVEIPLTAAEAQTVDAVLAPKLAKALADRNIVLDVPPPAPDDSPPA